MAYVIGGEQVREESRRQVPYGSAACVSGLANSKLPSSR
jgi:hypothetical protein